MKRAMIGTTVAAMVMAAPAYAATVIDQSQPLHVSSYGTIDQGTFSQSFTAGYGNSVGGGIYLSFVNRPGLVTLSLLDNVPGVGAILASGSVGASGAGWYDVFWNQAQLNVGQTYWLAMKGYGLDMVIEHGNNSYAGGSAYIGSFQTPAYDLTFRTYADDTPSPPVPEAATWAMMVVGFGAIGFTMRARRKAMVTFA